MTHFDGAIRAQFVESSWARAVRQRPGLSGALLLLAAVSLLYGPSLGGHFIWDDDSVLLANPLIKAPDGLRRIWFSTEPIDYFPLVYTSFWVEWRIWGLQPAGYQVTNMLLHGISAVLLWRVLRALSIPGAFLAAFIFAIHPVNVESVAWITQRKNTLPMVFYLSSLLTYLCYDEGRGKTWYYWSVAFFVLALLGKTMVVPLPIILILFAAWRHGHIAKKDIIASIPYFILSLIFGLITVWFQYTRAMGGEIVRAEGFLSRLACAGWAVWFYLGKALLPIQLSFVYPRWEVDPGTLWAWVPLLALAALAATLWRFRNSWGRPGLFSLGYFTATLLPVIGFLDIYFMRYSLVADHWQYLSLPSVAALISGIAAHSWHHRLQGGARRVGIAVGATVLLSLSVATAHRASLFRDNTKLWKDTLRKNSTAWMAYNNLGAERYISGDLVGAAEYYTEALRIKSDFDEAWVNLAITMRRLGRNKESDDAFANVVRVRSADPIAHVMFGNYLLENERASAAEKAFRDAIHLDPNTVDAVINLAVALVIQGRVEEAVAEYRRAIKLRPNDAATRASLGNVLMDQGRLEEAEAEYRSAVRLRGDLSEARYGLALTLWRLGRREDATVQLERLRHEDHLLWKSLLSEMERQ